MEKNFFHTKPHFTLNLKYFDFLNLFLSFGVLKLRSGLMLMYLICYFNVLLSCVNSDYQLSGISSLFLIFIHKCIQLRAGIRDGTFLVCGKHYYIYLLTYSLATLGLLGQSRNNHPLPFDPICPCNLNQKPI